MQQRRVNFHTLGCKLNFSESSTLAREFEEGGFVRVAPDAEADICVVNSCSVTEHADKKCRNLIRKLHRRNPGAIIAVTGCYAQLKPQEIAAIEGVDIVLGNNDKGDLYKRVLELPGKGRAQVYSCDADSLTSFFAAFSSGDRTRAFLKVQDGCDYKCAYCTIHYARGGSRNMPVADLVAEARRIAAAGQKEIVLTGVNTGDFGRTTGEKFIDLLRALDGVDGIERYRISSIEPNLLTDEIIAFCATSPKFQHHFHIPLQSGSDKILGLNIGADDYVTKPFNPLELVARVKSQLRRFNELGGTAQEPKETIYKVGGLQINDDLKQVTVDGEFVKLTPIEYNILLLLMKNQGKVFSINQIYESIWNEEAIGADNTVAVHIRHIREKIEINPKDPRYLKVVWGVGYKIEKA